MTSEEKEFQTLDTEKYCKVEASVVTGFEECARGEAREKFGSDVKASRGKIIWSVPLSRLKEVMTMGSIDNFKVVMHTVPHFGFSGETDSLSRLQKMVLDIDWESGLKAWRQLFTFAHPIASKPDVIPSPEDLVDVQIIARLPQPKDKSNRKNKKQGKGKGRKNEKKTDERKGGSGNSQILQATKDSLTDVKGEKSSHLEAMNDDSSHLEAINTDSSQLEAINTDSSHLEAAKSDVELERAEKRNIPDLSDKIVKSGTEKSVEPGSQDETADMKLPPPKVVVIKKKTSAEMHREVDIKVIKPSPVKNVFPTALASEELRHLEPMEIDSPNGSFRQHACSPHKVCDTAVIEEAETVVETNLQDNKPEINASVEANLQDNKPEINASVEANLQDNKPEINASVEANLQDNKPEINAGVEATLQDNKPEINESVEESGARNDETDIENIAKIKDTTTDVSDSNIHQNNEGIREPAEVSNSSVTQFATNIIQRLSSPPTSPAKDIPSRAESCVTPPPTPILSVESPFLSLNGGLPDVTGLASVPGLRDDQRVQERDSGSSVDPNVFDKPGETASPSSLPEAIQVSGDAELVRGITGGDNPAIVSVSESTGAAIRDQTAAAAVQHETDSVPRGETTSSSSVATESQSESPEKPPARVVDPTKPKFRVTCNRVGEHRFDSSSAAASFGSAVITYFNWPVDLKHFDIEVLLNIDHEEVSVSLALTRTSLHNRNLVAFGPTTLRATICYNMLRLCRIRNGDFICDPMCGTSAIPVESAINWVNCYTFGGDFHEKAIERTAANLAAVQQKAVERKNSHLKVDAVQWNIQNFPLRDSCVDVFVSDLPFGHRLGSRTVNRSLYPCLLNEMARTARTGARACLLTEDRTSLIKALQTVGKFWQRRLVQSVNIGGLSGFVFVLIRTTAHFERELRQNVGAPANSEGLHGGSGEPVSRQTAVAALSDGTEASKDSGAGCAAGDITLSAGCAAGDVTPSADGANGKGEQ